MLLLLGTSVPVLACNALRLSIDTGLTCGEVAEGLNGIHGAALVGIDPVETYKKKHKISWTKAEGQSNTRYSILIVFIRIQCYI